MKKRITSWGKDTEGKKHFFTFDLQARTNKVDGTIIPGDVLTQETENLLNNQWREGGDVPFPEGIQSYSKELTVTESILPEGYELDNPGLLKRSQTEWNFMVMSQKLADLYHQEAEDFKEKIEGLTDFDHAVWESLKTYWNKVNQQIREKNLLRKHANDLHDQTNDLFDKMKSLRKKMDNEFREMSEKNKQKIAEVVEEIENKIESGMSLQPLFNQLKKVQNQLKKTDLTKGHRRKLWDRIDKAFKEVKAKRYGEDAAKDGGPKSRLQNRYDGLLEVIERMERSIKRDRNDLDFQTKRINTTAGQLEAEIRKAKIQMIEERISSKQAKLDDMKKTKIELEGRLEKEKAKEKEIAAKKAEQEKVKKAKEEIQQKIEEEMSESKVTKEDELNKLLHAAEAINESRSSKKKKEQEKKTSESGSGEPEGDGELRVTEFISDQLEDIVDTARAVAAVVGKKIDEAVHDMQDSAGEEE